MVGTEEEWEIAEKLYGAEGGYQIRQMALYFKLVPTAQNDDPGEEYKKVLAFKAKVFAGKQHLCGQFGGVEDFGECIEEHLSGWLAQHLKPVSDEAVPQASSVQDEIEAPQVPSAFVPDFSFWMGEAKKALDEQPVDHAASLSYATKAQALAKNDKQIAEALLSRGARLSALDRSAEAIALYDEVISRFDANAALAIDVANALLNKGFRLGALDRSAEAVTVYNELISRFDKKQAYQEHIAKAMFNKAYRLGHMGRNVEAIALYDELMGRFDESDVPAIQDKVAGAMLNKGFRLGVMGRSAEAIAVYDELISRFGESAVATIDVAKALFNKGSRLGVLNRSAEAIAVFDEVVARFGKSEIAVLQVVKALLHKGLKLSVLGRGAEAVQTYDELINNYVASDADEVQTQVTRAAFNKACALAIQGRVLLSIAALEQWIERRGGVDCTMIAKERAFDAIRARPAFAKFMTGKGCVS